MTHSTTRIDQEALQWAVRLDEHPLSAEQQAAFDRWLTADTRHRGALLRAQAAWLDIDRLAALRGNVTEPSRTPTITRRWVLAASIAAATIGVTTAGLWYRQVRGDVYETAIGEIRRVTLSDGSSLLLNTATRAQVRFTPTAREVELVHGEGLFEVAKDPKRPFIVHTGNVSVRAVGTVFSVRAIDKTIDVTVTEGIVELTQTQGTTATPQRVSADQQATINPRQAITVQPVTQAQIDRHLSWRDGMLSFDGEPLSDAVAEINRHNSRQIRIDDPTLANRPVVGVFRASDTEGFAQTIATAMGADAAPSEDAIHLRERPR
jgi:transmembrane sensor